MFFTADWSGPCRVIGPVFEKDSEKYTDLLFVKIDVDIQAVRGTCIRPCRQRELTASRLSLRQQCALLACCWSSHQASSELRPLHDLATRPRLLQGWGQCGTEKVWNKGFRRNKAQPP